MNKIWYHGSNKEFKDLNLKGSGLNLWGSKGSYLSSSRKAAEQFGNFITEYELNECKILNTDSEVDYSLAKVGAEYADIPFMVFFRSQIETYGELIVLMGEYLGDKSKAVEWLKNELEFDAILTPDVKGRKNGKDFSEGDVLVVLNADILKDVDKKLNNKFSKIKI